MNELERVLATTPFAIRLASLLKPGLVKLSPTQIQAQESQLSSRRVVAPKTALRLKLKRVIPPARLGAQLALEEVQKSGSLGRPQGEVKEALNPPSRHRTLSFADVLAELKLV